ncbi:MAG: hypothetical protein AAGG08_01450, partial [Actinomycetota bacterium]
MPARTERRVAIIGAGVVGERLRHRLGSLVDAAVIAVDTRRQPVRTSPMFDDVTTAVIASSGAHVGDAAALIARRIPVVSIGDRINDLRALLSLDHAAIRS